MTPTAPAALVSVAARDLWDDRLSWLGLLLTLVTAGAGTTCAVAYLLTGSDAGTGFGGTVLGMMVLSVVAASSTLSGLMLDERRATYARWRLAGVSGAGVAAVVLARTTLVAAVGAVLGTLTAPALLPGASHLLALNGSPLPEPPVTVTVAAVAVGVCVGSTLLGVLRPTVAVAWAPPLVAVRSAVVPRSRPRVAPTLLGLLFGASFVALLLDDAFRRDPSNGVATVLLVTMTLVPLAGWYIGPLLQWTRLLHVAGPTARVAAGSVRARSAFTSALVVPWFLVASMTVGLGSSLSVLVTAQGGDAAALWSGLALLSPVAGPPLVAGLGSVCVMRRRRVVDDRTLRGAGASRRHRAAVVGWEAVCVVVTVAVLTLAVTVAGVATTETALVGRPFPAGWADAVLWFPLGVVLGVMLVLVTLLGLLVRRDGRRPGR